MFATICLPNFYLQAALRHQTELAGKPVALIDDQAPKAVIIQLNPAAEDVGVRSGMTPSQGLARCLELIVKTRMRAQERLLDQLLLQFAHTLTPYVEATAPGICTVQFTDTRNLAAKVERMIAQLAETGITASAGIAPTPDTSLLAAHLARPVLQVDDTKTFLAALPIETLAISQCSALA
jgi:nucleotidyltransferase/DNA polymerase involved in DNA repair